MSAVPALGLGIGWRPELALLIEARRDLGFVEVVAENFRHMTEPLAQLRERGVAVLPHGVSLSLGGAALPDPARLAHMAALARTFDAPLVSEHLAFTRAGGLESGHLLPVPRTRETLPVVIENVRAAQAALPVPLALENIATLFEWPDNELTEAQFLAEVLEATGALLLLDVENLYANQVNHGVDAAAYLDALPLERLAYVHVAGGMRDARGLYHDTHAHAIPAPVLDLLGELARRVALRSVMIERDDRFPPDAEVSAELDAVAALCGLSGVGEARRVA